MSESRYFIDCDMATGDELLVRSGLTVIAHLDEDAIAEHQRERIRDRIELDAFLFGGPAPIFSGP